MQEIRGLRGAVLHGAVGPDPAPQARGHARLSLVRRRIRGLEGKSIAAHVLQRIPLEASAAGGAAADEVLEARAMAAHLRWKC